MIVHIGGDDIVFTGELLFILDARMMRARQCNREFVLKAIREKRMIGDPSDAQSLIVSLDEGIIKIYCSKISSATLARRAGFVDSVSF